MDMNRMLKSWDVVDGPQGLELSEDARAVAAAGYSHWSKWNVDDGYEVTRFVDVEDSDPVIATLKAGEGEMYERVDVRSYDVNIGCLARALGARLAAGA